METHPKINTSEKEEDTIQKNLTIDVNTFLLGRMKT